MVKVYENGAIPPTGVTVILPVFPPKQLIFTEFVTDTVGPLLFNKLYVTASVQEFTSITITVCVPDERPEIVFPNPNPPPSKEY